MRHEIRPRTQTTTPTRTASRSDAAERRSTRRRRSAHRVSDGVISAYIHDLSQRHRPNAGASGGRSVLSNETADRAIGFETDRRAGVTAEPEPTVDAHSPDHRRRAPATAPLFRSATEAATRRPSG
jgi:hypothetical protein